MHLRGQSTVEAMITFSAVLLVLALTAYVRHDTFVEIVAWCFNEVGSRMNLP